MRKERFEWFNTWCDETNDNSLPRILIVGDSIANGYSAPLRKELIRLAHLDHFTTSYAIDNKLYFKFLSEFVKNSHYDLIQFNFGLHGWHIGANSYSKKISKIIEFLKDNCEILLLSNTTLVTDGISKKVNKRFYKKIIERNQQLEIVSKKHNLPLLDMFSFSVKLDSSLRTNDGFHFTSEGYEQFALEVKRTICSLLKL